MVQKSAKMQIHYLSTNAHEIRKMCKISANAQNICKSAKNPQIGKKSAKAQLTLPNTRQVLPPSVMMLVKGSTG
jgi:hypothetical protein